MKIDNFSGYINYKGEEYIFTYEDYQIQLIPITYEKMISHRIDNTFNAIVGKTKTGFVNDTIINGICFDNSAITICIIDYPNSELNFKVRWMYIHNENNNPMKIKGINFISQEINYFYDIKRYINDDYQTKENKFKSLTINVNSLERELLGNFKYKDYNIEIYGDMAFKKNYDVSNNLELWSKLSLESKDEISDLNTIYEIVILQKNVIDILTYRKNNTFDSIEIYTYKNEERIIQGRFYINNGCIKETNYKNVKQIITSSHIKNIGKLYKLINERKIYLSHLSESHKLKSTYDSSKLLGILIAYERMINWKYSKSSMRNKEYLELLSRMKQLTIENKEKLCTGLANKNTKFKNNVDNIFKPKVPYSKYIKQAIEDYPITLSLIENIYGVHASNKSINKISERINELRNNMAHGNIDIEVTDNHIKDIHFMEILIYILILTELGLKEEEIASKIVTLFNIKNFLII